MLTNTVMEARFKNITVVPLHQSWHPLLPSFDIEKMARGKEDVGIK